MSIHIYIYIYIYIYVYTYIIIDLLHDSTRKRSAFKIVDDHFEHVPMNTNNMLANFTDANGQQHFHSHILHLLHVAT